MSVTIVFGGQYGDEGKGKVAHFFAVKEKAKYCVRVGGVNSDHTVYRGNERVLFHILPTGSIEKNVKAVLPAGTYIDINLLKEEMRISELSDDRLLIDENAVIISTTEKTKEETSDLQKRIGSTNSGTGAGVIERVSRNSDKILAKNCHQLKQYVVDTKSILRQACSNNEKIIIEGTQGYGLSVLHAKDYPYVTSRDTSAAGALSETGLSPFDVENIVMVIRAFPIRVAGNSGPLKNEISWDIIKNELGVTSDITEFTSCTNMVKRIARFDAEIVKRSLECNKPNIIVLNHMDYIDYTINNKSVLSSLAKKYLLEVKRDIQNDIHYVGTGKTELLYVGKV